MRISLMLLAVPALLLAGCNSEPEPVAVNNAADDRTAAGDVQGGTISDAMLPLESVRSQSPALAPEPSEASSSGQSSTPSSEDASQDESAPAPEPQVEAQPQPAPEPAAEPVAAEVTE